jgi:acyl carrier protein
MSDIEWKPRNKEEVERKFIDMINAYFKMNLEYPLDPDLSLKDLKLVGDESVKNEIAELDPADLEELKKNYEVDSIDILELVIQIEEEFGVVIDDKEIATLLRWEDLIGYIVDAQEPPKQKK